MNRPLSQPDIGDRLDRMPVTLLHCAIIGMCALGFAFDLLEISLGSALSAVFAAPASATTPMQLSLLLASVYVGAVFGSPLLGRIADHHGRRVTLIGILALLATASLCGAFSADILALTVWRCIAGLALGGYPPVMIAYLTDLMPARRRGMLILVAVGVGTIGPAVGIFLVRALSASQPLGLAGWRWGLIIGGAGAAIVAMLFFALPESPRWLLRRGRVADADAGCQRFERSSVILAALEPEAPTSLPVDARHDLRRRWAPLALLFFLSPWSTVAFPILSGALLSHKGFTLSDTLFFVGVATLGPLAGNLIGSFCIDAIGRRAALAVCAAGMTLCGYVFVASSAPWWIMGSSFAFTLCGAVFIPALNLYGAELFSTTERATAIAGAWAFNRLGAAMAPFLLLPLLASAGPLAMYSVIALSLLASIVLLRFAPAGRERQALI